MLNENIRADFRELMFNMETTLDNKEEYMSEC
jgi:hypothetical protein